MECWGTHRAPWQIDLKKRLFDTLRQDLHVDVVVVGAGITGLMTATSLQEAGCKVVLLTHGEVGSGTTGVSTGHLTQIPDCSFSSLISNFDEACARAHVTASGLAIDEIEKLSKIISRDCSFRRVSGFKFTEVESEKLSLKTEMSQAQNLGLNTGAVSELMPFPSTAAFEVKNQAMVDPLAFVIGLAERFTENSGLLFENSRVVRIDDQGADKILSKVDTVLGSVTASSVVLATHTPIGTYLSLQTRLVPQVSYVMTVRLKKEPPQALYWDNANPYSYVRPLKDGLWLVGGRDHKTGQEPSTLEKYVELSEYINAHFDGAEIVSYWSGEFYDSVDGLPYIGKIPFTNSLYTGTAFSGTGLTSGVIASQVISDLILKRKNEYSSLYEPSRVKPLASGGNFFKQNVNVAKWMISDHLTHHHIGKIKEIAPNEGRVIDVGDKRLAIYRNENGRIHVLSSKCTHMGGIVHWNSAEKTWDCPCHGGRYKANGEISEGPQLKDLEDIPLYTEENPDVTEILAESQPSSGLSPVPDQCGATY